MGIEIVTVRAGAARFSAFRQVDVEQAIDEAALSFKLVIAAEQGGAPTAEAMKPRTALEIYFNADLAFRGYSDRYQPRRDGHDEAEILVSGRSKSQDFVDCSALHETGNFQKQTLLEIAQALDQFGIGISSDQQLDALDDFQITPGETAFRAIEKKLRSQGLTLAGQRDGSLKITKAGTVRHAGGLISGVNIKGESADLNWSHRHSKVIVRGQQADGHGDEALAVEAQAQDEAVTRNRPILVVADDDNDGKTAQQRADTRIAREAGESIRASIKTQGFRDEAGEIWMPGKLVWLESEFLGVTQVMLIQRAAFSQSRGDGSIAVLDLIDPRAFDGKDGKSKKSRDPWVMKPKKVTPQR